MCVLHGEGAFCAGADLKTFDNPLNADMSLRGPMGISRFKTSKPVIASITGFAVAGGIELALWCDLRVVDEEAVMGVFCRRFGVPLIDGGTVRLPRLIGRSRALDLILTGRPVSAQEAKEIGMEGPAICREISTWRFVDFENLLSPLRFFFKDWPIEWRKREPVDRRLRSLPTRSPRSLPSALRTTVTACLSRRVCRLTMRCGGSLSWE